MKYVKKPKNVKVQCCNLFTFCGKPACANCVSQIMCCKNIVTVTKTNMQFSNGLNGASRAVGEYSVNVCEE